MPLSLSYFYLRGLNTSKELSCLVDTGVHLGEEFGNPLSLSESTDVIFFTLPASEQPLFCLLSTSATLSLLCPDTNTGYVLCDAAGKATSVRPFWKILMALWDARLPLWSRNLLWREWQTQRRAAREKEGGQIRGITIRFLSNYSKDWACARAAIGLFIFPEALMCILLMK